MHPYSSLASPDSETCSNTVVLVGFGTHAQLARLEEMKISKFRVPLHISPVKRSKRASTLFFFSLLPLSELPHVLMIDIATFERSLYATGERGIMPDPKFESPRTPNSTLSFDNLLLSFHYQRSSPRNSSPNGSPSPLLPQTPPQPPIPQCALVNAGNEAFMSLFAFQMLLEGAGGTRIPTIKKGKLGHQLSVANLNAMAAMNNRNMSMGMGMGLGMVVPGMGVGMGMGVPVVPGGTMPMYGIPTMPGIPPMIPNGPGVPMAGHVNGGVGGSLPPSPPLAPTPGDTKGVSSNQLRTNGVGGGKKAPPRSSSAYDLSREFKQMQLSVARSVSSGAVVQSRVSGSDGEQSGKSGSRTSTSRGPSPLGGKKGHSRNSSYGSNLR